ncbi:MAG: hypothetical protein U0800_02230 [Isosphaeraceae bacterium]
MAGWAERVPASRRGLTVLDVLALVLGSSVASVHARPAFVELANGAGWAAVVPAFLGMAVTSAGPFLRLSRRWAEGKPPGPADGIRYWSALGCPWIAAALVRAAAPWARGVVQVILVSGLLLAGTYVVVEIWRTRMRLDDDQAPPRPVESQHWTGPVGTAIAVAWPLQLACDLMIQETP